MYHSAGGMAPQQHRPQRSIGESPGGQTQRYTSQFLVGNSGGPAAEEETDAHRIAQRQKQIDYGKNTLGYQRYTEEVPRHSRRHSRNSSVRHPETPDVKQICSKRSFDGQVKKWRRELHRWDPEDDDDALEPVMTNQLPSPGEPAPVAEPLESPHFFSPKKQKTAEGHVVVQRSIPPWQATSVAKEDAVADNFAAAPSRKQLSTGSKRTYQDMDADTASFIPASRQPAPEPEAPATEVGASEQASPVQADTSEAIPEADDDFGPAFEFH